MKLNRKQTIAKVITLVFSFIVLPIFLVWLALILPASAAPAKHYTDLQFSSPPEIKLPDYSRFQLRNGMIVYLMEDHELPLVSGSVLVRTGDRLEPGDKVGLAGLTGAVMRSGGTQKHPPDELNQRLEQRAASVEAGISSTSGSVSFSALSEDLTEVFDLFSQVIQQPAFVPEKFNLAKLQAQGGIARRNDDPNGITSREFKKLIYGNASPYARTIEYTTLEKITRNDLVNFYQQYFYPSNLLMGIVGDFDSKAMRSQIEAKFNNWNPAQTAKPSAQPAPLPKVSQANPNGIFFVNQPQLTQSYIQVGHLGDTLRSPDYPALSVMDNVLSGFGGRLFNEVRSRQGLAYSVYASWSPQFDYPGMFVAGGQTRSDATVPFIKSVSSELEKIRTTPVTETELAFAKDSVLNSFIFNFQDPSQTLSRLLRYEYFGYPKDFIFQYRQRVESTSTSDIQRVAQKYLQPDKIVTLVVGNQKDIQPTLATLGQKVTTIDIAIPTPQKS
ncbi:MAG: insulinase family protein [Leptolyngbyaceae cyanobacterium SU_3_3]|nr:insulinase family protein [Leptolyngbyaceae cyanobacterium SU_3_3]NJR52405.1 insulinase family protein [Leptolyngbyaceae cyanobacterium CSU_1_3]